MTTRPTEAPDLNALAGLASELASTFVALSSDIALVIDADGSVRRVVQGRAPLTAAADDWIGRPWADTVTRDTRTKIEQLLLEVGDGKVARQREVNLPAGQGSDIPVAYAAVRLGPEGPVLAVGRDLRAIAAIQQRFTESQQEMERDYWKRRQNESRYRLLFQAATDAVTMVDGLTLTIVEANRAAGRLLGVGQDELVGQHASVGVDAASWPAFEELLTVARSTGRAAEIRVRLPDGGAAIDVSATPFRAERDLLLLVRARAVPQRAAPEEAVAQWADLVQRLPESVVITDSAGHVLMANPAFFDLCDIAGEAQVEHRDLAQWLGPPDVLAGLLAQVRRQGIAAPVNANLGGIQQRTTPVSVSAVLLDEGDRDCVGFTIRRSDGAAGTVPAGVDDMTAAIEQLGSLLGRKSLPDLVNAAAAITERHLIAAALRRVGADASVAATLLGISADALSDRMRHYGLSSDGAPSRTSLN